MVSTGSAPREFIAETVFLPTMPSDLSPAEFLEALDRLDEDLVVELGVDGGRGELQALADDRDARVAHARLEERALGDDRQSFRLGRGAEPGELGAERRVFRLRREVGLDGGDRVGRARDQGEHVRRRRRVELVAEVRADLGWAHPAAIGMAGVEGDRLTELKVGPGELVVPRIEGGPDFRPGQLVV